MSGTGWGAAQDFATEVEVAVQHLTGSPRGLSPEEWDAVANVYPLDLLVEQVAASIVESRAQVSK
jgi:hypothetical protein